MHLTATSMTTTNSLIFLLSLSMKTYCVFATYHHKNNMTIDFYVHKKVTWQLDILSSCLHFHKNFISLSHTILLRFSFLFHKNVFCGNFQQLLIGLNWSSTYIQYKVHTLLDEHLDVKSWMQPTAILQITGWCQCESCNIVSISLCVCNSLLCLQRSCQLERYTTGVVRVGSNP